MSKAASRNEGEQKKRTTLAPPNNPTPNTKANKKKRNRKKKNVKKVQEQPVKVVPTTFKLEERLMSADAAA